MIGGVVATSHQPHRARLTVVSSLSLGSKRVLSLLVLGDLVGLVLAASLGGTDLGQFCFGDWAWGDHCRTSAEGPAARGEKRHVWTTVESNRHSQVRRVLKRWVSRCPLSWIIIPPPFRLCAFQLHSTSFHPFAAWHIAISTIPSRRVLFTQSATSTDR